MLDSLVRVSRRVGWRRDQFATDPRHQGLIWLYLALDGVYHPLWAAFSNNPTPRELAAVASNDRTGLTPVLGKATIRRTCTKEHDDNRVPVRYITHPRNEGGFSTTCAGIHAFALLKCVWAAKMR